MGFTPRDVDAMSLWEFVACADGWRKAQPGYEDKPPPPTEEEHEELLAKYG